VSSDGNDIERAWADIVPRITTETVPEPSLPYISRFALIRGDTYVLQAAHRKGDTEYFISQGASRKKTVQSYPLTPEGWKQAFAAYAQLEPRSAEGYIERVNRGIEAKHQAKQLRQRMEDGINYMSHCTYLGGHGIQLQPGKMCDLLFESDGILVIVEQQGLASIPYFGMHRLEITGRGQVTKGGGFIGGGFGLEGAVVGMVVASMLNALTTQTKMETVLQFETQDIEAFFHYGRSTPEALRIDLSEVFGQVRRASAPTEEPRSSDVELADRLVKLADLRREGLLSAEEFEAAKRRLFGRE
jgi:hypothetical protein